MDYMIRILPNSRILVRDLASKESHVLKADQVSSFFENVLEEQLKAQKEEETKINDIQSILRGDSDG